MSDNGIIESSLRMENCNTIFSSSFDIIMIDIMIVQFSVNMHCFSWFFFI